MNIFPVRKCKYKDYQKSQPNSIIRPIILMSDYSIRKPEILAIVNSVCPDLKVYWE